MTHAALMRGARLVGGRSVDEVLTGEAVSDAFGVEWWSSGGSGRWTARADGPEGPEGHR